MNNEQRRIEILNTLKASNSAISANDFAKDYSVTRQIIVADIALLRAAGYPIRAEHRGYVLEKQESNETLKRIVVKHGADKVTEELYAVVDNGGRIVDVIVEHPVYGKISAELNLSSRYEVDLFVKKISDSGVAPLSQLTDGLHIHTISLRDASAFDRIVERLNELGVLVEY